MKTILSYTALFYFAYCTFLYHNRTNNILTQAVPEVKQAIEVRRGIEVRRATIATKQKSLTELAYQRQQLDQSEKTYLQGFIDGEKFATNVKR